jgi:hypothetical protein
MEISPTLQYCTQNNQWYYEQLLVNQNMNHKKHQMSTWVQFLFLCNKYTVEDMFATDSTQMLIYNSLLYHKSTTVQYIANKITTIINKLENLQEHCWPPQRYNFTKDMISLFSEHFYNYFRDRSYIVSGIPFQCQHVWSIEPCTGWKQHQATASYSH